jgi:hypothetical protein
VAVRELRKEVLGRFAGAELDRVVGLSCQANPTKVGNGSNNSNTNPKFTHIRNIRS